MTLEVPNLFIILAFVFLFFPTFFLLMYGILASFWRVKRKKKERQHETFVTEPFNEYDFIALYEEEEDEEE